MLETYNFSRASRHSDVPTFNYNVAHACVFPVIAKGLENMMSNLQLICLSLNTSWNCMFFFYLTVYRSKLC